jgi:uncharacterized RDD family membrane protein YckC
MPCKNHPLVEDRLTRCAVCAEAFCPDCIVEIVGLPYCMECKTGMLLDLLSGVPPSGLDMASIPRRFAAMFVDGLVLSLPLMIIVFFFLVSMGGMDEAVKRAGELSPLLPLLNGGLMLAWMGLVVVYEALMLAARGQTVGKRMLNIKVVTADGSPISRGQAWGRTAIRQLLGMVPCLGLIDYLVAFGSERTCIHDILVKTRVVNWND